MGQYIMFENPKVGQSGQKYEAFVKRMITEEDNDYFYIGEDKFLKSDDDYDIGEVIKDIRKD